MRLRPPPSAPAAGDRACLPSALAPKPLLFWTVCLLAAACGPALRAQSDTAGDPTGSSGGYNGLVTTGGAYDAYTGNARRVVSDLTVPGSNGAYPLGFTRIANSRLNVTAGDTNYFGEAGNWRHSYQWNLNIAPNSNKALVAQVAYPDGAVINFRTGRASAPSGETLARGPAGTSDRLDFSNYSTASTLYLSDGGQVVFTPITITTIYGTSLYYRATRIIDPFGAVTLLNYYSYGQPALSTVIEPGGRALSLVYASVSFPNANGPYSCNLLSRVLATNPQGATVQSVAYNYSAGPANGSAPPFELTGVTYGPGAGTVNGAPVGYSPTAAFPNSETSDQGGWLSASYTYQSGAGGALPLLATCDDPHYAGAMSRIRYAYDTSQGVWGALQAEQNLTTGEPVASLSRDQPNAPSYALNFRGDKADANNTPLYAGCYYGQTSTAAGATNALPFQPTSAFDFQGAYGYTCYNPAGSANGAGYVSQTTDRGGLVTTYQTEPFTGKALATTARGTGGAPDLTRSAVWTDRDGATTANPYFLASTTDARGQSVLYHRYPNTGFIYQIDYPDGGREYFNYRGFSDNHGGAFYKVSMHQDQRGAQTLYAYDETDVNHGGSGYPGLLTSATRSYVNGAGQPCQEPTRFFYDALDRLNQVSDPQGVTNTFLYNGRHQLANLTHAADGTHLDYTYDNYGYCVTASDELGHVASTAYDEYHRALGVSVPVNAPRADGAQIASRYRAFAYERRDNQDRLLGDALSHTSAAWSAAWLPSGNAVQRIFSANGWVLNRYDGMYVNGGVFPVVPGPGNAAVVTSTAYNAIGQPTSQVDAQNQTTTFTYDCFNRPQTATDPLSHSVTKTYYPGGDPNAGLLQSVTYPGADANYFPTATTRFSAYDAMGRLLQTVTPPNGNGAGVTSDSNYDLAGNVVGQGDGGESPGAQVQEGQVPGAHLTGYAYDQLGRKSRLTYPDGTFEKWSYDASGNVKTYKNRAGVKCTYQYTDGRNRCTGYSWNDNQTSGATYSYYANGLLREASNDNSDILYAYDDANALTAEDEVTVQPKHMVTRYTHDLDGNVDSITYPNGNYPCFSHDSQGRVTSMYSYGTTFSAYSYSGDRLTSRALYNGLYTYYDYQNNGRVWDVWHIDGTRNKSISRHCYGYAPNGQISWFDREADGGQSGSSLENGRGDVCYYYPDGSLHYGARDVACAGGWPGIYGATADSRVNDDNVSYASPSASTYGFGYNYDAAGNRTQVSQLGQPAFGYGDNGRAENQYTGSGYDGNGNTTSSAVGWTYAYDAENKLANAAGPNGQTLQFFYDAAGRLAEQVANGAPSFFCYAGAQRIEEHDVSNNPVYLYFYDAPGSDRVLFRQGGPWGRLWYQSDLMGNTTHLSAESYNSQGQLTGGYVVEQYLYDAYGTPSVYDPAGNARPGGSLFDNRSLLKAGSEAPAIRTAGDVIVDGNHRYIAGRVFGTEPAQIEGTLSDSQIQQVTPIQDIELDPTDWGNY